MTRNSAYRYACPYIDSPVIDWDRIEGVPLTGTVAGEPPRLRTTVKLCRTEHYVHARFECEDDHVVATYANRDDPIYKEDVVEIFIDETGSETHYKEFEFSPRNVIFDALIVNEPGKKLAVDAGWNVPGLKTAVTTDGSGNRYYDIAFPMEGFDKPPVEGTEWKVNFYRIDADADGQRYYWAWSPTGKVDFHIPSRFGTVVFE